ncbi:MAG: hypothetical protein JW395_3838 [Nitrospira sp.]|nr:hypothetical protein [Nitrospira sp.]
MTSSKPVHEVHSGTKSRIVSIQLPGTLLVREGQKLQQVV